MSLPPDYINDWITGDDRTLLETFYEASNSEGGSADEVILRGLKAVLAQFKVMPVPVSERLPEATDCDTDGRCWWLKPYGWRGRNTLEAYWIFGDKGCSSLLSCTCWLPANALPLPAIKVPQW